MVSPAPGKEEAERPIGELVQQLVDEGKGYARAELALVKAIGLAKAEAARIPAILLGAAFLLAQAAVVMVAFGVFSMTYWYIGPVLAALLTAVIFGGGAWLMVREAIKRLGALK